MSFGVVQAEKMTTESGYSLGAGNASSFKNRIINGGMTIDQRNAGASLTINSTTPQYPVDRMVCGGWASAGVFTAQQSTTATAGFINSLVFTVTTTSALSTSGEEYLVRQNIEGLNVSDFQWGTASAQPITISFWVRSSLTGTFAGSVTNSGYDRSYVFTYTINSANTYEYKTVTIPGDTSGTWLKNNSNGMRLQFNLGAGSLKTTSAGSWSAGYFQNATGSVQLIGTNGATFYITGVQLEVGTVATSFDFRSYGTELALCQRYYWQHARGNNLMISIGVLYDASNLNGYVQFPVSMRSTPSIVQTTGTNYYIFERVGATDTFDSFGALTRASTECGQLFVGAGISGATGGQGGIIFTNNSSAAIGYSAEL